MRKRFMTVIALMFAMGCNFGGSTTVYYPSSHSKKAKVVDETPYYHTPEHCTDYGVGVGYCCSWAFGYGECMSEWCFWEDTCEWEHNWDECYYDDSDYYYEYY